VAKAAVVVARVIGITGESLTSTPEAHGIGLTRRCCGSGRDDERGGGNGGSRMRSDGFGERRGRKGGHSLLPRNPELWKLTNYRCRLILKISKLNAALCWAGGDRGRGWEHDDRAGPAREDREPREDRPDRGDRGDRGRRNDDSGKGGGRRKGGGKGGGKSGGKSGGKGPPPTADDLDAGLDDYFGTAAKKDVEKDDAEAAPAEEPAAEAGPGAGDA